MLQETCRPSFELREHLSSFQLPSAIAGRRLNPTVWQVECSLLPRRP